MRNSELKVRKDKYGKYNVWVVYKWAGEWPNCYEVEEANGRYGKKADAVDYCLRKGGHVCYVDFDSKADALDFLAANLGRVWW